MQDKYHDTLVSLYNASNYQRAEETLNQWLDVAMRDKDLEVMLMCCNELTGLYRITDRAELGVKMSELALQLIDKMGLVNTMDHAITLMNTASVSYHVGNIDQALGYDRLAEVILESLGRKDASLYFDIASLYQAKGNHIAALNYLDKTLLVVDKNNKTTITIYMSQYKSYLALNKIEEAEDRLNKVLHVTLNIYGKNDTTKEIRERLEYLSKLKKGH